MKINELKGLIVSKEKTYKDCSKALNISVSTFNLRLKKGIFTNKEIECLMKYLDVQDKDKILNIFFDFK